MILYTTVGVSDLGRSVSFYGALFEVIGLDLCFLDESSASWGRKDDPSVSRFSIGYPFEGRATAGNGTMTAFRIPNAAMVDRLHALALRHGGSDEGKPGRRPHYGGGFYNGYVRDPTETSSPSSATRRRAHSPGFIGPPHAWTQAAGFWARRPASGAGLR